MRRDQWKVTKQFIIVLYFVLFYRNTDSFTSQTLNEKSGVHTKVLPGRKSLATEFHLRRKAVAMFHRRFCRPA